MTNLFQRLACVAARGAGGLASEAREAAIAALRARQCPDGGFAGLDGRSDPYFTFFTWMSLRAACAAYDRGRICAYMASHRRDLSAIDARCAELVLAHEGAGAGAAWLRRAVALLCGDAREVYAALLLALATGDVPRWAVRLAWRRQRKRYEAGVAERLPTPRLAAGLILATLAGDRHTGIGAALESRRCAGGGFASAPGAWADLLATAVARFSLEFSSTENRPLSDEAVPLWANDAASRTSEDLAFVEACWLEDGLFGASPRADRGDAEHTFYGLLALGTCR